MFVEIIVTYCDNVKKINKTREENPVLINKNLVYIVTICSKRLIFSLTQGKERKTTEQKKKKTE
jgi:hypothetical protein